MKQKCKLNVIQQITTVIERWVWSMKLSLRIRRRKRESDECQAKREV